MLALLIERIERTSEECLSLSSDPDSEDELPFVQVVVNNRPTKNMVEGIGEFIERKTRQNPKLVEPDCETWFGFAFEEEVNIHVLYREFLQAFPPDGNYSIRMIELDMATPDEISLSLSQELDFDATA